MTRVLDPEPGTLYAKLRANRTIRRPASASRGSGAVSEMRRCPTALGPNPSQGRTATFSCPSNPRAKSSGRARYGGGPTAQTCPLRGASHGNSTRSRGCETAIPRELDRPHATRSRRGAATSNRSRRPARAAITPDNLPDNPPALKCVIDQRHRHAGCVCLLPDRRFLLRQPAAPPNRRDDLDSVDVPGHRYRHTP